MESKDSSLLPMKWVGPAFLSLMIFCNADLYFSFYKIYEETGNLYVSIPMSIILTSTIYCVKD